MPSQPPSSANKSGSKSKIMSQLGKRGSKTTASASSNVVKGMDSEPPAKRNLSREEFDEEEDSDVDAGIGITKESSKKGVHNHNDADGEDSFDSDDLKDIEAVAEDSAQNRGSVKQSPSKRGLASQKGVHIKVYVFVVNKVVPSKNKTIKIKSGIAISNAFVLSPQLREESPFTSAGGITISFKGVYRRQNILKQLLGNVENSSMKREIVKDKYGIMLYFGTSSPDPDIEERVNSNRNRPAEMAYPPVLEVDEPLSKTQKNLSTLLRCLRSCDG